MHERGERLRLATLFFLHAQAAGMWGLAMSNVLRTHGLERIVPYTFACAAVAAMISPLILGSLADQHIPANRLLRWLAVGTSLFLGLTSLAIERGCGWKYVLALLQMQSLCAAPMWGITTTIILARLREPDREFGPIRVWGTIGFMAGGWITSFVLLADSSTRAGFTASALWLGIAAFSLTLPEVPPLGGGAVRSWRDLLGLPALALLAHRDHRVVFLTAALFSAPLAAFFPFAALHLGDVGVHKIAAAFSLGQTTEIIAMYGLSRVLARVRLKWIFLTGIGFGALRFGLFALDTKVALLGGIALHGLCYTLFFITAQLYLEKRVEPQLRARAQALLTLVTAGIGTLAGAVASDWWRTACRSGTMTHWPQFWLGLTAVVVAVFVFFAAAYRGVRE